MQPPTRVLWCILQLYVMTIVTQCMPNIANRLLFRRYLPGQSYRNILGITLKDCVEECVFRKRCQSMNFNRKFSLCYLNEHTGQYDDTQLAYSFDFVFGTKQSWTDMIDTTGCDAACSYREKCSLSGAGVTCSVEECLAPPNITNGSYRGNKWSVGMTVKYECDPGYNFTGSQPSMTCNSDGNWTAINPGCQAVEYCPTLTASDYSTVTFSSGQQLGSVATFTCHLGYSTTDVTSSTCIGDTVNTGVWSVQSVPTCTAIVTYCPTLTALYHSAVIFTAGQRVWSVATFTCSLGYSTTEATFSTCIGDTAKSGTWTVPTPPTCSKIDTYCPMLTASDYSSVTFSAGQQVGSVATFSCSPGYSTTDVTSSTCIGDTPSTGIWSVQAVPTCTGTIYSRLCANSQCTWVPDCVIHTGCQWSFRASVAFSTYFRCRYGSEWPVRKGEITVKSRERIRTCDTGWLQYGGSCLFFDRNAKSWSQAESNCLALYANLVMIKDEAKNSFVESVIYNPDDSTDYWLGAKKAGFSVVWMDNSLVSYQPNSFTGTGNCIIIGDNTLAWQRRSCTSHYFSICEKA